MTYKLITKSRQPLQRRVPLDSSLFSINSIITNSYNESSPRIPIHMKIALGIISSIAIFLQTDLEAKL